MAESFHETVPETVEPTDLATRHADWLTDVQAKVHADLQSEWQTHETFSTNAARSGWVHYGTGNDMIWRFSSQPTAELISIDAMIDIDTIIKVIGKHSGGNDKTNAKVRTSSFCRNIGALLGTAASAGGDKNVLYIINNAEYIIGIDMKTLAAHGISARPALHRLISLFETEYVLVSTPGNPPVTLDTLATVRYRNPLKGKIDPSGRVADLGTTLPVQGRMTLFTDARKPVTPDMVTVTGVPELAWVTNIVKFGVKCCAAANPNWTVVQMKEGDLTQTIMDRAMGLYITGLR